MKTFSLKKLKKNKRTYTHTLFRSCSEVSHCRGSQQSSSVFSACAWSRSHGGLCWTWVTNQITEQLCIDFWISLWQDEDTRRRKGNDGTFSSSVGRSMREFAHFRTFSLFWSSSSSSPSCKNFFKEKKTQRHQQVCFWPDVSTFIPRSSSKDLRGDLRIKVDRNVSCRPKTNLLVCVSVFS